MLNKEGEPPIQERRIGLLLVIDKFIRKNMEKKSGVCSSISLIYQKITDWNICEFVNL